MKTIVLIAGTEHTRMHLHEQLKEYLNDIAYIKSYAVDEDIRYEEVWGDVFVFSSREVQKEVSLTIPPHTPVIIGKRTIDYSNIDKLLLLPKGSSVLFVNDIKETAYSCIDTLLGLEIDHIKYFPYYPGIGGYKRCDIAVTPGEEDKVPKEVKTIVNIGPRSFDMSTITKIMYELGLEDDMIADMSVKYIKKIIELSKKLAANTHEVIEFENNLKNELMRKRYYAKYSFEDIIGDSPLLREAKRIASKLAVTDLSILLYGESGTGKELFASAIHLSSKRKNNPFIAVNFSAIPESLIESELFGYEGGSFTGAKKQGKTGLFEQANGGTIFLDEIGDAPLAVQVRLLRVLQEKEIMRVGGDRIIPLDIRVVAATNKKLPELITHGKFREDLYYRLNMGGIKLPPLRERPGDIHPLASHFLIKRKKNMAIKPELITNLVKSSWRGNVRELFNVLEYALAMCEGTELGLEHIPEDYRFVDNITKGEVSDSGHEGLLILRELLDVQNSGFLPGRTLLGQRLRERGIHISEYHLRNSLKQLESAGYISMSKGKTGTRLTPLGLQYLKSQQ